MLSIGAATPDWPDRMHNEFGGKPKPFRKLRLAYLASTQKTALVQQFRPRGAVNGTIHATAAH